MLKVIQTRIGSLALAAFIGDYIPKKAHKKTRLNIESRWPQYLLSFKLTVFIKQTYISQPRWTILKIELYLIILIRL